MRLWVLAAALIAAGSVASAGQVQPVEIAFSSGRVTMSAADAPVADVLAAWGRAGHTELAGAEYLGARRISIRLTNANEADALRALIGSPAWYSTVPRDAAADQQSTFARIVVQPAASSAAYASAVRTPESRYFYDTTPDVVADAAVVAAVPPAAGAPQRPANVEPEAFYHYDADLPPSDQETSAAPAGTLGQPAPPVHMPEEVYSYSPTPEPDEPAVGSAVIPPPPAFEPEVRFSYDSTPEVPVLSRSGELIVPDIPVVEGWIGRLPGRAIRYVIDK